MRYILLLEKQRPPFSCLNSGKVVTESSMVREERFEFGATLSKEVAASKCIRSVEENTWGMLVTLS